MRSREFGWLIRKEFRELFASRAFWLLLLVIGPLVGQGFITAVDSYAEASGIGGGPSALAQGLSPLDGIFVPSLGAYDLAVTLLFPFVVIHLVAGEKQSGAWKLMLQTSSGISTHLTAKVLVIFSGWLLAWVPGLAALVYWKALGGTLYAPEVLNLLLGHLLRVVLSTGVAMAAAAIASGAASAAIATLGFTVGTWVLEFIAVGRGGWLQAAASYTPTAALRGFEQGELRLSAVVITVLLGLFGFVVAGIWLSPRESAKVRAMRSALLVGSTAVLLLCASTLRPAWDFSENRRNGFPAADEAALRKIQAPLQVTVYLAPEDPRLNDLDRNVLSKLQRILPQVDLQYAAKSRAGLFEATGDHYGEVWYEMSGRKKMSRSTTELIVLAALYELAQVSGPTTQEESAYAGHPLAARPTGAALFFYGLWPCLAGLACWLHFKN